MHVQTETNRPMQGRSSMRWHGCWHSPPGRLLRRWRRSLILLTQPWSFQMYPGCRRRACMRCAGFLTCSLESRAFHQTPVQDGRIWTTNLSVLSQRDISNHLTSLCIAQDAKRLPVINWNVEIFDLLMMAWVWQVFALAAQCALTGNYLVNLEDCLDLWALAASLQV